MSVHCMHERKSVLYRRIFSFQISHPSGHHFSLGSAISHHVVCGPQRSVIAKINGKKAIREPEFVANHVSLKHILRLHRPAYQISVCVFGFACLLPLLSDRIEQPIHSAHLPAHCGARSAWRACLLASLEGFCSVFSDCKSPPKSFQQECVASLASVLISAEREFRSTFLGSTFFLIGSSVRNLHCLSAFVLRMREEREINEESILTGE